MKKLAFIAVAGLAVACTDSATVIAPVHTQLQRSVTLASTFGLAEISRPNAVATCNTGNDPFGTWSNDDAGEPTVAVNPVHSNNVVAAWIQGPFQEIIAAVSSNGGQSWQQVPLPLTICTGGPYTVVGDPWLSFAPNGDLYAIALALNTNSDRVAMVTRSGDGGLDWSPALVLPASGTVVSPPDHPSITADPTNASLVYAIWNGNGSSHSTTAVFTRTTDGGRSWEPARAILQTAPQSFIQFSQILVLPNGTLVDLYEFYEEQPNAPITVTNLQTLRSTDHGQTWSSSMNGVTMTPLYITTGSGQGHALVEDPETQQFVTDVTNPSFAIDGRNGNLYAVWEDGRFSNFQYNDVAFSMSTDGGFTWSVPIRVNQTPLTIPPLNRQAFFPIVAVAANGTIGVSYYDFRFSDPNPGLPTDRWLVQCQSSLASPASDPASWGKEVRLTSTSFNMEAVAPMLGGAFFLGDYFGLAAAGNAFVSTFTAVDNQNVSSIFARRVGQ